MKAPKAVEYKVMLISVDSMLGSAAPDFPMLSDALIVPNTVPDIPIIAPSMVIVHPINIIVFDRVFILPNALG
jgi:hypothetical protein